MPLSSPNAVQPFLTRLRVVLCLPVDTGPAPGKAGPATGEQGVRSWSLRSSHCS